MILWVSLNHVKFSKYTVTLGRFLLTIINKMKNFLYIVVGIVFLAMISGGASGFLTSETSSTLDNLYTETFYIDPESVEVTENLVNVILFQNTDKNGEKKVLDCIEFYKNEFTEKNITCTLQLNKNIALEEKCDFVVGAFTRENEVENLILSKNTNC